MRMIRCLLFFMSFLWIGLCGHAQLNADFSMDRVGGCTPLHVNFTNLTSGASAQAIFSWDFGNGNSSALRSPSAIYTQEKSYTVTLKVTEGSQTSTKTKTITVYKKPVVDFSVASPKVCIPASAQFNVNATAGDGSISSYQWDFGDGTTSQGYGPVMYYAYGVEQIATVGLTVTNSYGCQSSIIKPNIVEILPRINPVASVDKTMLCAVPDSIRLTNNSTGPGTLQYLWDFGDGTSSSVTSPSHVYKTKGLYQVTLTVSNTVGCSVNTFAAQINAAYFKTAFSSSSLCRQVSFTSSSFLYPSSSLWQFGDGGTLYSSYGANHTYATAGTYNVSLINTYGSCKDTVTNPITVLDQVNYNSGITMPSTVCQNTNVSFASTSSTAPSLVKWDFGDGYTSDFSYTTTSHTYSQPGTYTVKMTNVFGTCSETVTKTIVVNALPNPQGFTANYGSACGSPVTVTFTDTTKDATGWSWIMDYYYGSQFSNKQTASYFFNSDGYHTVTLTVTNAAGCSRSTSKPINIFRPSASIYLLSSSSPRSTYDCDSLRIRLGVNTNQTIQSYSWDLGNGTTSTSATPEAFYGKPGTYSIRLNYVTESGCNASASYAVTVYDKPKANFTYSVPCGPDALNLQFRDASYFSDNWQWSFGDGGYGYSSAPTHYYRDTGLYTVRFINQIGHCSDTIYKTVYANVLPSSVTITKAENTCNGTRGTVTFDQRSLRATGLTWNFGDGTTMPYDTSMHAVTHTYTATGSYQVTLTGIYNNCTLTSVVMVRVLLKQSPVLSANKTQLCASDPLDIQINNLVTNPFAPTSQWGQYSLNKVEYNTGAAYSGYLNYSWDYTTYKGTLQNFAAGVSKMRAIIANPYTGCLDTTNYINVQVNGPVAGFKVQQETLCFKSPFVFTDTSRSVTSTALTSWTWDFGDGATATTTTPGATVQHTYNNPGRYLVQLRVRDASNCSSYFSYYVNASGTKAAFTPSGLYIPNVPLNTTVTFYNNSYSYNSTPTYNWQYGDGSGGTGYSPSHTYTQAGTDTVRLIVTDALLGCSDTVQKVITVKDFNTAFSFTTSFLNAGACPPVMVRINNLSVGFTRLLWDFGDGTSTTSSYYPSHIYQNPGKYKITLYTYGYNGLTGTYIDSIEIEKPSAQISADVLQGCLSQNVNLQASAQNTLNYLWDFGDGVVSTGAKASAHPFNAPGIYTPRLIVKSTSGCAASADLPEPIIIDSLSAKIQGIPTLICDSASIAFAAQVNSFAATRLGATLSYKWDFGTGNAADTSTIANPAFRYVKPGTYTVKLRVSSPYGCVKETSEIIVVHQKAKGSISGALAICQEGSVKFNATATPSANVQWNWDFGNGNTSVLQNPPAQVYTNAGNYSVVLLVNKNGCIDTVVQVLTVHPKPVINASPKQPLVCYGSSVNLTANGGGLYQWSPATGLSGAAIANPVASPAASTVYRVTVTTDKGCVHSDSVSVTVAPPIRVQLLSDAALCEGNRLTLNASGASSYQWINTVSGLSNTAIANPVATPVANTVYTVVGSDAYNCFKDTASIHVTLHQLPTVNAGPDVEVLGDIPYQLSAKGSSDVVSWLWSPANSLSCSNCANPVITPKMETSLIVQVKNQWGCSASDTVVVKVTCALDRIYIPNAFTPNNDGNNDVFYIKGSGVKIIKYLRIFNRWGEVIFERTNFPIDDRSFGWNGQAKGYEAGSGTYVYLAEMQCSSGEVFTKQGTVTLIR